jgi:hypothetical protein
MKWFFIIIGILFISYVIYFDKCYYPKHKLEIDKEVLAYQKQAEDDNLGKIIDIINTNNNGCLFIIEKDNIKNKMFILNENIKDCIKVNDDLYLSKEYKISVYYCK